MTGQFKTFALVVVPWVYQPYMEECLDTLWKLDEQFDILAVNNSHSNKGVAESWNFGIDSMGEAEWLVIVSASMRFNDGGACLYHLEDHPEAKLVYFVGEEHPSWRCVAIHRDVIKDVGYFDPNFYPAYFEDVDYEIRVRKAGYHWTTMPLDARSISNGHGVELGGVEPRTEELIAYFVEKWGRHPSAKELGEYERPFNNGVNLGYFPTGYGRSWNVEKD